MDLTTKLNLYDSLARKGSGRTAGSFSGLPLPMNGARSGYGTDHAYFPGATSVIIKVSIGLGSHHNLITVQSLTHMFWGSGRVKARWSPLLALASLVDRSFQPANSLLDMLKFALRKQDGNAAWLTLVIVHTRHIWNERNAYKFKQKNPAYLSGSC